MSANFYALIQQKQGKKAMTDELFRSAMDAYNAGKKSAIQLLKNEITTEASEEEYSAWVDACTENYEKDPEHFGRCNETSFVPRGKQASEFEDREVEFLWYPYIPLHEYSVFFADSGTGKTFITTALARYVTTGKAFFGSNSDTTPERVLFISSEDDGAILKSRLERGGADTTMVDIIDRDGSLNLDFNDGYAEFAQNIKYYHPKLVLIDPWQAFLGKNVNMNQANQMRPVLQQLSHMAKDCNCAIILISHVNKKAQGENANYSAMGSSELINASRSAFTLIKDPYDEDARVLVHTKANYARLGESVRFVIEDGGAKVAGYSSVTKEDLEAAARSKSSLAEYLNKGKAQEVTNEALISAILAEASPYAPQKFTYNQIKKKYGVAIFGGCQAKRALERIEPQLKDKGFVLTYKQVRVNGRNGNGFIISPFDSGQYEQTQLQ